MTVFVSHFYRFIILLVPLFKKEYMYNLLLPSKSVILLSGVVNYFQL